MGAPPHPGRTRRTRPQDRKTTVWQILTDNDIDPSPNRSDVTWTEFLLPSGSRVRLLHRRHSVPAPLLRVFFISVETREVFYAGITTNPTGEWTTHAARNLFLAHADRVEGARALVRDRGSQFVAAFDEIFRSEGFKILPKPARTPVANTFAERWVSDRSAANSSIEPASGTADISNASSSTTSRTTTSTGPTAPSTNSRQRPTPAKAQATPRDQPSESSETSDATAEINE